MLYDNRDLKISKSKKSQHYFRDEFEIFIRLFDEHFVRLFESQWLETLPHTNRRTKPPISLAIPHPSPPPQPVLDISKQIEQRARLGEIFARWHLAIAITSVL